ncbi:MAG: hypothetical protein JNK78_11680 [Planctomycetes bacterium]|nr:hypothetical protein [Planctomycetota bacterium]
MNRHDLVFAGVRLLGVYFLAAGLVSLPSLLEIGAHMHWSLILAPIVSAAAGYLLAVKTDLVCGWLAAGAASQPPS